jgi:hypothetical protein
LGARQHAGGLHRLIAVQNLAKAASTTVHPIAAAPPPQRVRQVPVPPTIVLH